MSGGLGSVLTGALSPLSKEIDATMLHSPGYTRWPSLGRLEHDTMPSHYNVQDHHFYLLNHRSIEFATIKMAAVRLSAIAEEEPHSPLPAPSPESPTRRSFCNSPSPESSPYISCSCRFRLPFWTRKPRHNAVLPLSFGYRNAG